MIIIHNKEVFFSTSLSGVLPLYLDLKDLLINDSFILPINSRYYHFLNQDIKQIPETRLSKDTEHICIKINKDKSIWLITKDNLNVYEIQLPNNCSLLIDDFTLSSEKVFFYNLNKYKTNNYNIKDIVEDIHLKTCFQHKCINSYTSTLDILFSQDLTSIVKYEPKKPKIRIYQLSELTIL